MYFRHCQKNGLLNVVPLYLTDTLIRHIIIILLISVKERHSKFCFIHTNTSRDHAGMKVWSMLFPTSHFFNKMITFRAVVFAFQGGKLLLSQVWTSWTVNESSFHPSLLNMQRKPAWFSDHRAVQMTEGHIPIQRALK